MCSKLQFHYCPLEAGSRSEWIHKERSVKMPNFTALKSLFIAKNAYSLVDSFLPHNNSTQVFFFFPISIHLLTVSFKIGGVATLSDRYCNTGHCMDIDTMLVPFGYQHGGSEQPSLIHSSKTNEWHHSGYMHLLYTVYSSNRQLVMWSSVMFCCSTSYSCKIVSYLLKFHDSSPTSGHWMNVGRLTSRTRRSHFTACIVVYWSSVTLS